MNRFARAALAFLVGAIGSWVAVSAAFLFLVSGTPDRDGGRSMSIVFGLGPFAAAVGGVVAAWLATRRRSPPETTAPDRYVVVRRICAVLAPGSLGIVATHGITAGGFADAIVALAIAAALGAAALLMRPRPS
jgi:hypothetical protein